MSVSELKELRIQLGIVKSALTKNQSNIAELQNEGQNLSKKLSSLREQIHQIEVDSTPVKVLKAGEGKASSKGTKWNTSKKDQKKKAEHLLKSLSKEQLLAIAAMVAKKTED